MEKSLVRGTWQQKRSFSPAVITKGAQTIVWVAGHTGAAADDGRSLAGNFDAQFHQVFSNIGKTLAEADCSRRCPTTQPCWWSVMSINCLRSDLARCWPT